MVAATMEWRYLKYFKFTGSTGKFLIIQFLESKSVLGVTFSIAYNTSTETSTYIENLKNYYPSNFPKTLHYLSDIFRHLAVK